MNLKLFLFIAVSFSCIASAHPNNADYNDARTHGALTSITLKIADDERNPIPAAKVHVLMGMNFREKAYFIDGITDTNGVFTITGKTTGDEIEIEVTKTGYYRSLSKITYIAKSEDHKVEAGKWLPYPVTQCVTLRRIKSPVKMECVPFWKFRHTKAINQWIGYDIAKSDFVTPFGSGTVADFDLFIKWDGLWLPKYSGMEILLQFKEPFSGYYICEIDKQSDLKGPYAADTQKVYVQEAKFFECVMPDGTRQNSRFDKSKCWVVRSRCKTDSQGKLIEARYSLVNDIAFSCKTGAVGSFRLLGAMNPNINDVNLEVTQE